MPMVESAEAVKNIDEILSGPGVDAVYVGPSDLSLTLGCKPRLDQTDPPVVEAQQRIVEARKRHGVVAGIHNATAAYALQMIAAGYQFVTLASDSRFLAAKAAEEGAAGRKTGVGAGKLPGDGRGREERTAVGGRDDCGRRSGLIIAPVVVWGGSGGALVANPAEVASVHRVPLADLDRPDVPRLVTIPESDRPVIQVPLLSTLVHAPTAAVLYQVREVVVHGRPTRVGRPWTTTSDRKSTRLN